MDSFADVGHAELNWDCWITTLLLVVASEEGENKVFANQFGISGCMKPFYVF